MSIYRGPGGPGDAVNDSSSEASIVVIAKDAALAAQVAAELAATEAEASAVDAAASAVEAASSASSVGDDADDAAASAAAAAASAAAAATSEDNAATSATDAETSNTSAAAHDTAAASAASAASASASTATTQASNASSSASAASTSETNAASSASSASTSATNASSSATAASGSASAAATSAANASTSETNAAASATSASGSATTATTQAGIATTQATNAASSASAASTSASNASTSATNAASSATSAATSASSASSAADAALAALDSFDDRYLGQKSTAPTLDNDGNALVAGALYFDTTTNAMKVWDGSTWLAAYASLSGALISTNNLSDVTSASAARTNLGLAISTNVQAWDADLDAIAAITGTTGLLKKTAANTWTLDTSSYLTSAVTDVSGTGPIASSGGNTPAISIAKATTTVDGYLSATDWNTFYNKQDALVSATNIKTINGSSVLGSGDLTISGGDPAGTAVAMAIALG